MAITTSQVTITTMEGWYSGATPPLNPLIGDLWLDTTSNEIKKYDGTNWIKQADTQGPQGPKGDSIKSREAYWIKSSTKPDKPDSSSISNWTLGSEPPENALSGISASDKFWRVYKDTYSNEKSEYSEVELIGSYEVLNGLVQFRNGVSTTENKEGQNITVIDGGKILTGSIEADKMSIKDLSALKAKIGGFNVGENSIYSGTKSSINNTEKGIYFDSNGHSYFGDDKNFIRFYQSAEDGKYKLQVSADSLTFGSGVSVEKAFEDIKGDIQNAQDSVANVKDQIVSMGEQLVINGNGLMGDNTNFSALIFDASKANGSPGSFTREGTSYSISSDTYIPINPNLRYSFEIDAISKNGLIRMYSFLDFYDVDKKSIDSNRHMYIENTLTYLTRDLKNGDTVVHFNDLSGWNDTFTQNYRRGFIFWNYTNSFGYTYPELTYSRNSWGNLYENSNVDKTNNTITLNAPWSHGTFEAGTKLSQCNSGATYKYQGMGYSKIPTKWTHYSGFYDGTDYSGKNVPTKFPPGTAYAKVGFLWNYDKLDDQCWVTNISLKTDYDNAIKNAQTAANKAQEAANSKRRVFYNTPSVPYDAGDLWVQGSDGDILRCAQAKTSAGSYNRNDWILASKYTDDSALNTWIKGDFATTIQGLEEGLVDAKIETYYQTTDPSTEWPTDKKMEHKGDLWYNSTTSVQKYYRWSGTAWQELTATPPKEVFDSIDNKATIYTGTTPPSSPSQGDLWFKGANEPILTYVGNTWVEYNKYTDNTRAEEAYDKAGEASKTADNYISTDSTGIMVSENKGATKETPSNATKNNLLITEQDVQIRNGQVVVASYGKSAIIGKNKSDNIQIKDNGFSINHDGNEMFAVKQEDEENNYINEIMKATYESSTDTYSLESSYKAYYPNKNPILYVIYRRKPDGIVSRKETIQYGDTKLPCTVSITEEGKYLVKFKKTDWDKSWRDMDPEIEMDYYAAGGGAMVTIGTRIDYGLANSGSWSLTVGSANTAGSRSIAVGENNVTRDNSVAIGSMCYAKNDAIAVGSYAKATSYGSAAIGHHVSTDQMGQLVVGHYNRETTYGTMFVVGCGGDSETANAAAIMDSGDIRLKGTVYVGCEKDSTGGKSIIDLIYPVGSIYMSVNSADPGTLFGGTWERIQDTFLLASGSTYGAGTTGGSAKATLPSHTHTLGSGGYQLWGAKIGAGSTEPGNQISGDKKYYAAAKGGSASNYKWLESVDSKGVSDVSQANMPPYLAVYVWKRIS